MLRKKQIVRRRLIADNAVSIIQPVRIVNGAARLYSYLDVPVLHQLDFILHVVGVSFLIDNIFLMNKSKTLSD